tara:strand:+ start:336 stop:485 length:150 start_codon:yes stop_codon:yes gene_type:complete
MVTQRQTLQQEVKDLQKELDIAIRIKDAFVQLELFKRLEIVKSTLLNLD